MTQIFAIALHALKSINEVVLGTDRLAENRFLAQAKLQAYTFTQIHTQM